MANKIAPPSIIPFVKNWITQLRVYYNAVDMRAQDKALDKAVGHHHEGSGTFMASGERDLDWPMHSVRDAEAAANRCLALGFVTGVVVTRVPRAILGKAPKGKRLAVVRAPKPAGKKTR